jgi:hypothetical protein
MVQRSTPPRHTDEDPLAAWHEALAARRITPTTFTWNMQHGTPDRVAWQTGALIRNDAHLYVVHGPTAGRRVGIINVSPAGWFYHVAAVVMLRRLLDDLRATP